METVAGVRAGSGDRQYSWTVEELKELFEAKDGSESKDSRSNFESTVSRRRWSSSAAFANSFTKVTTMYVKQHHNNTTP